MKHLYSNWTTNTNNSINEQISTIVVAAFFIQIGFHIAQADSLCQRMEDGSI